MLRKEVDGNLLDCYDLLRATNFEEWGGSCLGMVSVMALSADGMLDINAWDPDASNCFALAKPVDSQGACGTRDLINYYQLLAKIHGYPLYKASKGWFGSQQSWKTLSIRLFLVQEILKNPIKRCRCI